MRRIPLLGLALGLAVVAASGCNEHEVDDCRRECVQRDQERFADCVADGSEDCRPGNRRCCALDIDCNGDLGDQVVITPARCESSVVDGCGPECTDVDEQAFNDCLDGLDSCREGDRDCCLGTVFCRGTINDIAIFSVDGDCCDEDGDCLRDEVCDLSRHQCIVDDCEVTGICPLGHMCVEGDCLCGDTGETCHEDEICEAGECVEDPCLSCAADEYCIEGRCAECIDDFDCEPGFECELMTNTCAGCALTDETCDDFDDDCDGLVDEDFPTEDVCGLGVCERRVPQFCDLGVVMGGMCTPGMMLDDFDFTCDGLDDDCDGRVDEDCCGNDMIGGSEACDGTDLGGMDCRSFGFDFGTLRCDVECSYELSGCQCNVDVDMDRECATTDCDDMDGNNFNGNFEDCDGFDNDCDTFVDEGTDPLCDDGLFCNGAEQCIDGFCSEEPPMCDDGNDCTRDPCDEGLMMCQPPMNEPLGTPCFHVPSMTSGSCDGAGTCMAG